MQRSVGTTSFLAGAAALSRIEEVQTMTTRETATHASVRPSGDPKRSARTMWALGDYHAFALATVWEVGPVLVQAWGIGPGQRVLDVAAGTGNVAIRAAETGARVVASDLTPEHFDAGRREAAARGVELEWVEADAESLPFDDGAFDVVTSAFGAMFAPDHRRVADELVRVCRPGGTIGLASFTPEGLGGEFFATLGPFMPPPPPEAPSPLEWGAEEHVRTLLGGRVASLELDRREYVEESATPRDYRDLFATTFGPVVAVRASLESDAKRLAAFDQALLDYATSANRGGPSGPARYPYEYLLVVARTRA